jgi:hypothetical protein
MLSPADSLRLYGVKTLCRQRRIIPHNLPLKKGRRKLETNSILEKLRLIDLTQEKKGYGVSWFNNRTYVLVLSRGKCHDFTGSSTRSRMTEQRMTPLRFFGVPMKS